MQEKIIRRAAECLVGTRKLEEGGTAVGSGETRMEEGTVRVRVMMRQPVERVRVDYVD